MDTVKMTILPEAIYRFNAISIKLPTAFFTKLKQKNFTICMETQKTPKMQSNFEKKNGAGGINLLTSDYTTKLQSPRQYSTGTKAEI